tara:strand:+ start:389 stop:868 length:480 start_codon:yes stop_codon:yes gene_type:complete
MKITRSKAGKNPTRHGIVLRGLKPTYKEVLKKHEFIKDHCKDDNFVHLLFSLIDRENIQKNKSKYFIDPTDGEVKDRKILIDEIKIVPWKCSYCECKIKSKMEDFSTKNFTCKKCYKAYVKDEKKISQLVLENSVEFAELCKRLINRDRKTFLKYIQNK